MGSNTFVFVVDTKQDGFDRRAGRKRHISTINRHVKLTARIKANRTYPVEHTESRRNLEVYLVLFWQKRRLTRLKGVSQSSAVQTSRQDSAVQVWTPSTAGTLKSTSSADDWWPEISSSPQTSYTHDDLSDSGYGSRSPSPSTALESTLDPFFQLPYELSPYERSLLHIYFSLVPLVSLGLREDSPFCPLRNWMSNAAHQSVACLRWMTAAAEDYITSLNHTVQQDTYKRRSSAYRDLQKTILNADAEPEHALAGLVAAAVGDEANTKLHIKGLDALIRHQGGNRVAEQKLFRVLSPDVFIMAFSFRPIEVVSFEELHKNKSSFRANLRAMRMRSMWLTAESQLVAPSMESQQYVDALDNLLADPCIGMLLTAHVDPALPYIRRARHFTMLFTLHRNLMVFDDETAQQATFLYTLGSLARDCSAFDQKTGTWMLKPGAVVSLICHARNQVLQRYIGVDDAQDRGNRCSLSVINALKIFGYLSDASQLLLIRKLRDWLFADVAKHEAKNSIYDKCLEEIETSWLERTNA